MNRKQISTMDASMSEPTTATTDETNDLNTSIGASLSKPAKGAPRRAMSTAKSTAKSRVQRPPARPHRKLESDILAARIRDLEKKLSVLRSRTILLDDRLDAYKREHEMREEST